ncbi:NAD(P)H dehydrogenase (quinone) [Streptomyces sp. SAI-144]|jgi:NAD(P)H dehydrogenase (quinone)|uniref:NAD(P)H-binding protein n=1 Tax=Streptomyces sp. SAI-144 TaxID=2940544 RepID=UPI0024748C72|nr:NAD(P)H-binding protein [Streptomyces sp. SAI-144]MDH6436875.1 NAD(P)H dehydrogenase (quinone) [Streptomyces sp. SAI-144]
MIVVSAASGAFGRLVIDQLLARRPADRVVAAVRNPNGAVDLAARGVHVRLGDYDDPATLRTAFKGADRLLLISSPELEPYRRARQHQAAIDAARAAGVGSIAYTSFLGADTQADGVTAAHHSTERTLLASGLPHTLLRHPFYSEAFLNPGLHAAVASGELADGTGGRGINTAFRSDLAEAAARVLTEDCHIGRAYDFTGSLWTYNQLAHALSRISGKPVAHRDRHDRAPGVQGWLEEQVRAGALEQQTDDLEHVLGHPVTTLDQAVTAILTQPAPPTAGPALE